MDAINDLAYSRVAAAPSPADTGTTLDLMPGDATGWTVPFDAVIWPRGAIPTINNAEIVRVTDITADTLTIQRAQGRTVERAIQVGDQFAQTIDSALLNQLDPRTEFFGYRQNDTAVMTITQGGDPIAHTLGSLIIGTRQLKSTAFGLDAWWWFEIYVQCYLADGAGTSTDGQPLVVDFAPLLSLYGLNVIGARAGMPIGHAGGQLANAPAEMLHVVFSGDTGTACEIYTAAGTEFTTAVDLLAGDVIYMNCAFMAVLGN